MEVAGLCEEYGMDFDEVQRWYDGYRFGDDLRIYSPRSVVCAMRAKRFGTYWNRTETFEALRNYIVLNYDGLKDIIIELLAGNRRKINTGTFANDMTTFSTVDDVLTLLVHLGYLGYDFMTKEVFVPNYEVETEFVNAISSAGWEEVISSVKHSEELLRATWNMEAEKVAAGVEEAHLEMSILSCNDENSLSCTISLAYYSARTYYKTVREMPAGKGFADIVFSPRRSHMDKPAMIVELKWNASARSAITQIKERDYRHAMEGYKGDLLLAGINYDKGTKKHECIIEKYNLI